MNKEAKYITGVFAANVMAVAVLIKLLIMQTDVFVGVSTILLVALVTGVITSVASITVFSTWLKCEGILFLTKDTVIKREGKK